MSKRLPKKRAAAAPMFTEAQFRQLTSTLLNRANLAEAMGATFAGRRDIYQALGYRTVLTPADYRLRYTRGGIAKRLVEAFPTSTWRGGGELVESDDPEVETPFETAFFELNKRLKIWATFQKADVLAGLGRYGCIFFGAPGLVSEPLTRCGPDDLKYMWPFSERDITIESNETKEQEARYGMPMFYSLKRVNNDTRSSVLKSRVHHSRIIPIAEGQLDDPFSGTPRLEAVWNYLDDLEKIVGGGSEASWKRIDGGKQFKLDPTLNPTASELSELREKIELYINDLERNLTTRGVDIQDLGAQVSNFGPNAQTLIDLISATSGIPQRIFMGSERGELSSNTDQSNYNDRVEDRRHDFAWGVVVEPTIKLFIELGVLPEPQDEYEVRWPEMDEMDDSERMDMALKAAQVNQSQGETVIPRNEIRDRILGWPPIEEILTPEELEELDAPEVDPLAQALPEEGSDAEILARAARSKVKSIRMLRLTKKGRQKLKRKWAA